MNADRALDAVRDYFVRSAREAHNKGLYLDLNADDPESTAPEGYQPLEVQLEALEAFHTWWVGKLRLFKASSSPPTCKVPEPPRSRRDSLADRSKGRQVLVSWAVPSVQSKFKEAGGTWVAAADARSFSTGIENARYEGPLKLEIPIPLQVVHKAHVPAISCDPGQACRGTV